MDPTSGAAARPAPAPPAPTRATGGTPDRGEAPEAHACTAAQLRRFIKSRPYVPMHELRRRFELNGEADEVCSIATPAGTIYVGLPPRECGLLNELVRQGDIGLELCWDPHSPMVVGVYPMRPITRG